MGLGTVAVDDGTVYWASVEGIMQVPASITPEGFEVEGQSLGGGIAIDGASVYWTGSEAVMKLTPK
jgi:hypothetical protein